MISAVDLLKGIAVGTSMKVITVDGANGGLDTNYEGKAKAALDVLTRDGYDFVCTCIWKDRMRWDTRAALRRR